MNISEYKKLQYQKNREKRLAQMKALYQKKRQQRIEYQRNYRKTDMPQKLWEVRSTNVVVLKTYVRASTREEAKLKSVDKKFEEVSSVSKLTANQAWYGAIEAEPA